ncbi:MAG TPA: hypothetical protein VGN63_19610 [Flavisolibacter sp.]|nr:hypothetical protein [Flavisolibacter sp.]
MADFKIPSIDYIHVKYTIVSSLGMMEGARFAQEITGNIELTDEEGKTTTDIGLIEGYKLLFDVGADAGADPLEIMDVTASTMDVAGEVYDSSTNTWRDEIYNLFKGEISGSNLLIGCRIQILPEHRKKGIGKKVIKDFYNNFIQGCGLFGIKCFPLQHEAGMLDDDDMNKTPLRGAMNYQNFEKNYDKACKQLCSYYKKLGFTPLSHNKEIMVINPSLKNRKFDAIKLE